ncbi:MAG: phage tail tape measure protein [Acidobacteriaceae bacterium]
MANGVTIIVAGEDKTGEVFNAVQAHLKQTATTAKEAGLSMTSAMSDFQRSITLVRDAFVLDRAYTAVQRMVQSSLDLTMQLSHLHEQTGISTQNLSVLRYTAEETGVSFEALTKGFKKMSTDVLEWTNGSSKLAGVAFHDLGISMEDVKGKGNDMYGLLGLVADRFRTMPDGPHKLAIAVQLFGRSGQEMIPILNQGAEGLESLKNEAEDLGVVLDDAGVAKMEELRRKVEEAKGAFQGLGLELTADIAPALERAAETATSFLQSLRLSPGTTVKGIVGTWLQMNGLGNLPKTGNVLGNLANPFGLGAALATPGAQPATDAAIELMQKQQAQKDALAKSDKPGSAGDAGWGDGATGRGSAIADADRRAAAKRQLLDAAAKLDEQTARAHAQTMLDIQEDLYKRGLISEQEYLARKSLYQGQQFDAEERTLRAQHAALEEQVATIGKQHASTAKDKLAAEIQINGLLARERGIEGQLLEIEQRRLQATLQTDTAMSNAALPPVSDAQSMATLQRILGGLPSQAMPAVTLAKQGLDTAEISGEAEKFAHAIFDPLFDFNEKWSKTWKKMRADLIKDLGQLAESQLFGALFGDPEGRGGKSWNGMSFRGDTSLPGGGRTGLASTAVGELLGLFHRKSSQTTSNGGVGSGAGTLPTPAAALAQMGNAAATGAGGGIQVNIQNTGTPQDHVQSSQSVDPEKTVVSIVTKDLSSNGPIMQGVLSVVGML